MFFCPYYARPKGQVRIRGRGVIREFMDALRLAGAKLRLLSERTTDTTHFSVLFAT